MTGRNLPPDTGREITGLKRRVSDLEKALDRLRRIQAQGPATNFDTPFAIVGGDITTVPTETLTALAPVNPTATDPTRHIHHNDSFGAGWFLFLVPGFYEIGGTVEFIETAGDGDRTLAIQPTINGTAPAPIPVLTVARAAGDSTILSGSRIIYADRDAVIEWSIAVRHDAGADLDVLCPSYWARFVRAGGPPQYSGGA